MMVMQTLLALLVGWVPSPDLESQAEEAQKLLERRIANGWNAGIVIGLLDGEETRIRVGGRRSAENAAPLDGRTVFEIGSLSKAFTGILLAEAVERHEVRLDQPVAELLPDPVREKMTGDKAKIILLDLAQHLSGLARMPDNFKPKDPLNPYADYSVDQMYDYLGRCALNSAPGTKYEYSNLAMGLLGHVLARRAGRGYETLLLERICQPLGLSDTRIQLTPELRANLALGHNAQGVETSNWDIPTLAGAGAIRSTMNDLLLFAKANLKPSGALARAHGDRRRINPNLEMALGWHVSTVAGREIVWHNGETGGYHSFLGLDLKNGRAVAILSNSTTSTDDLGFHLLEPQRPLEPAYEKPRGSVERKAVRLEPSKLEALTGEYALTPTFSITITVENGKLMAQATGQEKFEVTAESETAFFYKVVDAQLTFDKGPDGKAVELTLHQNGQHVPGKKVTK
jgi:CubicO group peptidase (beta-lactamase class C family)